jgi:DNA-binding MarR family transcriptional regulator
MSRSLEHRIITGLERVGSVLGMLRRRAARAEGLTATQARVLRILSRAKAPGIRGVDLSRDLGVSRASAAETVAALVARGLVVQRPDPADRRVRRLRVTARGRALHRRIARWSDDADRILRRIDSQDRVRLLALLIAAIQGLEDEGLIPEARVCPSCEHFEENVAPGRASPHRCALTGEALGPGDLQVDCDAHRHRSDGS